MSIPTLTQADLTLVREIVQGELKKYDEGFEQRLARAIQKGFDRVLHDNDERLKAIEEDLAKLLRHTGLN